MTTFPEASAKIRATIQAIDDPKRLVGVGKKARPVMEAAMRPFTGGDLRLSNVGRSGAKVGVRFVTTRQTLILQATGPVPLIERAVRPHFITSRYAGGGRTSRSGVAAGLVLGEGGRFRSGGRRAVLRFRNGDYAKYAAHPGHRARGGWTAAKTAVRPVIPALFHRDQVEGLRRIW